MKHCIPDSLNTWACVAMYWIRVDALLNFQFVLVPRRYGIFLGKKSVVARSVLYAQLFFSNIHLQYNELFGPLNKKACFLAIDDKTQGGKHKTQETPRLALNSFNLVFFHQKRGIAWGAGIWYGHFFASMWDSPVIIQGLSSRTVCARYFLFT